MEKSFKQSVIEGLKYYVYVLVDPRNNCIFYVGKGSGNRVYQHAQAALAEDSPSLKLSTIRELKVLGLDVKYYIIRHNLSEQEAYLVESSIIALLTEGIKTDEEINILYDCPKIEPILGDRLLLVSLNKSYQQSKATGVYRRANDYESVRKYWKLSCDKADKVKYILGIYKGIVRIVIDVKGNSLCSVADDGTVFKKPRFAFVGDIVPDSPYLNTDVTDYPFGSGGAITYIPRTNF